jgi:hypothetical protein
MDGEFSTYGKMRNAQKFWSRNLKRRDHLEDQGIDKIILKWILKKYGVRVWT